MPIADIGSVYSKGVLRALCEYNERADRFDTGLNGGGASLARTSLWSDFPVNREKTGKLCHFGSNYEKSPELTA